MMARQVESTDDYTAYIWNDGKTLTVYYYNTECTVGWLANFVQIRQLVKLLENAPFFVIFNMQRFLMRVTVGKDHTCKMVIILIIIFYVKVLRDF